MLNCSPLSAVFSKPPPDDYGLCVAHLQTSVRLFTHSLIPYPHITDLIHLSTFLIQGTVQAFCTLHTQTHTHTLDVSETFTDHMQAHTNVNTCVHRSILLST